MLRLKAFAAAFLALTLTVPSAAFGGGWEVSYEKDGVTVSKKDVPDTPLVAFKGDTVYDADIRMVMGVLLDNDHRIEWVDRLYTNHIVEQKNEFDYVLYQAFELPALFADRDYVYHGIATRDPKTGVVELTMNSIEHPKAPETVGVRAQLLNSRYILTPLEDGKKTRVEVEILTDPKGWMPAWLTNMVQKEWPVETLNGIRGQFAKDHAKPHPLPGEAEEAAAKAAEEAAAKAAEEGAAVEGEEGAEGEDAAEGEEAAEGAEGAKGEATEAAPAEKPAAEAKPATDAKPADAKPADAKPAE